ncbi:MAG: hypothetical protein WD355_02670 [Balneolaceae bacterium]
MPTRECPSCAVEVDTSESDCPICGYEFPQQPKGVQIMALIMAILILIWLIF